MDSISAIDRRPLPRPIVRALCLFLETGIVLRSRVPTQVVIYQQVGQQFDDPLVAIMAPGRRI
jgi:hypothetical protein